MADVRLDENGRLPLPPEALEALGWKPGQEIHLSIEGDQLLAQPATRATTLKDEALRLADAMKGITREAARQVADAVSSLATPGQPGVPAIQPSASFHGVSPLFGPRVYLAPGSTVIGDVGL